MLIPLSRGLSAQIDDEDKALVAQMNWCASGRQPHVYAVTNLPISAGPRRGQLLMHRVIMGNPAGLVVDHVNGDTLDNRRANLRTCAHRLNIAYSQSRTGISQFKGVTYDRARGKWKAQIRVDRERRNLGRFDSEEAAALAYDAAALDAWGEFALTNITKLEAEHHG